MTCRRRNQAGLPVALLPLALLLCGARPPSVPEWVERRDRCAEVVEAGRLPHGFWSEAKVLRAIRHLYRHREEIVLLSERMSLDRSLATARRLEEVLGVPVTGAQLHAAARNRLGNWQSAMEKAIREKGFRYQELQGYYGALFWTDSRMLSCIRFLHENGVGISEGVLQYDDSLPTSALLFLHTRRWTTGQSLYVMARRRFGSWVQALELAKLDPELARKNVAWTRPLVIHAITALARAKEPLNVTAMMTAASPRALGILKRIVGKEVSGGAFHAGARTQFGSWDRALWAAEIDPATVRLHRSRIRGLSEPNQTETLTFTGGERRPVRYLGLAPETPPSRLVREQEERSLETLVTRLPEEEQELGALVFEVILSTECAEPGSIADYLTKELGRPIRAARVKKVLRSFETLWGTSA